MQVLIADDEATSLVIIQGLLKKEDCEAIAVDNGEDALKVLRSKDAPKLAILDWMMPNMDGIDVCKKIHELKLDKPPYIIMLTSKDGKADMAEALDSGADDYMIKPCDPIEFRARLHVGLRSIELREKIENQNRDLQKLIEEKQFLLSELEEDLGVAGSVQRQLFPREMPEDTDLDIAALSIPCNSLGGDMCDVRKLSDGRTIILMYDVAGHGVSSALIAAFAKASFAKIVNQVNDPSEILALLNDEILQVTPSALFLTAFLMIYDKENCTITYSGAGHIPQLHYNTKTKEVEILKSKGVPIGMMPNQKYFNSSLDLEKGDSIVLFTDGFTETFNGAQEMFGKQRMEECVHEFRTENCNIMIHKIIETLNEFRGHNVNEDDICILAIKR